MTWRHTSNSTWLLNSTVYFLSRVLKFVLLSYSSRKMAYNYSELHYCCVWRYMSSFREISLRKGSQIVSKTKFPEPSELCTTLYTCGFVRIDLSFQRIGFSAGRRYPPEQGDIPLQMANIRLVPPRKNASGKFPRLKWVIPKEERTFFANYQGIYFQLISPLWSAFISEFILLNFHFFDNLWYGDLRKESPLHKE